jgi:hypothetical protein
MPQNSVTFRQFLETFPEIELPVTLTEDSLSGFQKHTPPLSVGAISAFIAPIEGPMDAYVEYIPCFRLKDTHEFHAIVYWKGELMKYRYILVTYSKEGRVLANAAIAGIQSDGSSLLRSVATIDEDWTIHIVEGDLHEGEEQYLPQRSRAYQMELLATGEIIQLHEAE